MFGLYPAGSEWVRIFAITDQDMRDIQRSLVDHAAFTAAILHQPFGQQRGAVLAQSGHILVLSDTAGARQLAVTPTVQMQHLLWSYREGFATQWSAAEIRSLTGYQGWDELLTSARREFSRACEKVGDAIAGTLRAPVVDVASDPMREPFPNDDDEAFFAQMVAISDAQEAGSCAL